MNAILFLALVFFLSATVMAFASLPGGWSYVDPRDEGVQKAAAFAVRTKYHGQAPQFWVVLAKRQVVAGLNYDLTVEVSSENPCRVDHYQVYDRFGSLTLTQSDTLLDSCGSLHLRGPDALASEQK